MSGDGTREVTLRELAHARTGDKGNRTNIGLFAYDPLHYELLVAQVTPERVAELFAYRKPTKVLRYLLPKLAGMNLVLDDVLDGGVNDSLNLDMHGKALSFHLLTLKLRVPAALQLPQLSPVIPATPG
jgi:hypothetical protein